MLSLRDYIFQGSLQDIYSFAIQAFADANWGTYPDDRKSTIGLVIYLGAILVLWSSKKQASISRSSTEVEYRSIANGASEVL